MSFEQPLIESEDKKTPEEVLLLRNKMEIQLCARRFGFDDVESVLPQWIDQFGKAFGDLIERKPELLDQYEDDSDSTIERVADLLYTEKEVEK